MQGCMHINPKKTRKMVDRSHIPCFYEEGSGQQYSGTFSYPATNSKDPC